ncbi:MAG: hypothetical protein ACI9LY_002883 [Arenicella sp.]|jgi:hypothetical protein
MSDENEVSTEKKKSNARLAFFIALIPVALFIASFFIQR